MTPHFIGCKCSQEKLLKVCIFRYYGKVKKEFNKIRLKQELNSVTKEMCPTPGWFDDKDGHSCSKNQAVP